MNYLREVISNLKQELLNPESIQFYCYQYLRKINKNLKKEINLQKE